MNRKIEVCRSCTDQCALQKKSDTIVADVKNGSITTVGEIRGRVSKMLQLARVNGCPSSEIAGTQRETFEQTNPRLVISPSFMSRVNGATEPIQIATPRLDSKKRILDTWRL